MKRFAVIVVILFFAVLQSLCSESYLYYYFSQKIELKEVNSYLPVKFNSGTDINNEALLRSIFGDSIEHIYDFTSARQDRTLTTTFIIQLKPEAQSNIISSAESILLSLPAVENIGTALQWHDRVVHLMTNEIIVKFKNNTSSYDISNINKLYKTRIIEKLNGFENIYLLAIESRGETNLDDALEMSNKYSIAPIVDFAQPNFIRMGMLLQVPNDTMLPQMWNIKNTGTNLPPGVNGVPGCDLNMDSAWTFVTGNPLVLIGIIDTGTDTNHTDLRGALCDRNLWYAPIFENQNVQDCNSHGTAMCGIAGATGNNIAGIAGIAFNCRIMPIRVFDCVGSTSDLILAKGLDWGWRHGATVLSNSWGGGIPTPFVTHCIQNALYYGRNGKGTVVFAATGNDDTSFVLYPSLLPEVIAIGGLSPCNQRKSKTSCDGQNTWGANYGDNLSVVSPTPFIGCTSIGGGWSIGCNGTSSSCPQAAAIGALILTKNIELSADSVRMMIERGARKIGNYSYNLPRPNGLWNNEMGYGRIDAMRSLELTPPGPNVIYDQTPPVINLFAPRSGNFSGSIKVNAVISDNRMVAGGSNMPRLYYYTNVDNTLKFVTSINDSINNYTFNLPSVVYGAKIFYYAAAQDTSSNGNITTYPLGGRGVNPPGTTAPPRYMFLQNTNYFDTMFFSVDVPKVIDPSHETTLLSTLNNPVNKAILNVRCLVDMTHGYDYDLSFSLISPSGTEIVLTSGVGENQSNYHNTVFDDYAPKSISDTSNRGPFTGNYRPLEQLWLLNGENSFGRWMLKVVDNGRGVNGTLNNWRLLFQYSTLDEQTAPPMSYSLVSNYPNPYNSTTKIIFNLPLAAHTSIVIYDMLGRYVTSLLNEYRQAQYHDFVVFDANSVIVNDSKGLASGVYFYTLLINGTWVDTRKMVLIK